MKLLKHLMPKLVICFFSYQGKKVNLPVYKSITHGIAVNSVF